jgi:hypothetical protein
MISASRKAELSKLFLGDHIIVRVDNNNIKAEVLINDTILNKITVKLLNDGQECTEEFPYENLSVLPGHIKVCEKPSVPVIKKSRNVPKQVGEKEPKQVKESVPKQVKESVPKQVTDSVTKPVNESVPKQVTESVPKQVKQSVSKQVKESVPKQVKQSVPKKVKKSVPKQVEDVPKQLKTSSKVHKKKPKASQKIIATVITQNFLTRREVRQTKTIVRNTHKSVTKKLNEIKAIDLELKTDVFGVQLDSSLGSLGSLKNIEPFQPSGSSSPVSHVLFFVKSECSNSATLILHGINFLC